MSSELKKIFEELINGYDEEQNSLEQGNPKQSEINLDRYINERYFKFTVPFILDNKHQEE